MILGGLALAFSRIIDNSVISLENIYRHLEMGASPDDGRGGWWKRGQPGRAGRHADDCSGLFPGYLSLRGQQVSVQRAGAGGGDFAFCFVLRCHDGDSAVLLALSEGGAACRPGALEQRDGAVYEIEPTTAATQSWWDRFTASFNRNVQPVAGFYEYWVKRALVRPGLTVAALSGVFVLSLAIYPFLGLAFFPRTDAGQFTINFKVPTGTPG